MRYWWKHLIWCHSRVRTRFPLAERTTGCGSRTAGRAGGAGVGRGGAAAWAGVGGRTAGAASAAVAAVGSAAVGAAGGVEGRGAGAAASAAAAGAAVAEGEREEVREGVPGVQRLVVIVGLLGDRVSEHCARLLCVFGSNGVVWSVFEWRKAGNRTWLLGPGCCSLVRVGRRRTHQAASEQQQAGCTAAEKGRQSGGVIGYSGSCKQVDWWSMAAAGSSERPPAKGGFPARAFFRSDQQHPLTEPNQIRALHRKKKNNKIGRAGGSVACQDVRTRRLPGRSSSATAALGF